MLPNAHTKDKWQKGDCKKNKCIEISQEKKITKKKNIKNSIKTFSKKKNKKENTKIKNIKNSQKLFQKRKIHKNIKNSQKLFSEKSKMDIYKCPKSKFPKKCLEKKSKKLWSQIFSFPELLPFL